MDISKSEYLEQVLQSHRMAHVNDLLDKYREKRDEIKKAIKENYTDRYDPFDSGSYAKSTAINSKFDLDIMIPFKRSAFSTLQDMFDNLFKFLKNKYGSKATVRNQKVSIGIEFYPDEEGDVISIDVVPGRELKQGQYKDDHKLNLNINSSGNDDGRNHILTNIHAQIEHIKSKENERKNIRLLKIWKSSNKENYKSFFIELITIKAFENTDTSGNLWDKLKAVMEYVRDNITKDNFTLKDPGNSGNDVADTLNSFERRNLSGRMNNMLNRINDNEDNLKTYFPKNAKFDPDSGYGFKPRTSGPSRPPKNERFG